MKISDRSYFLNGIYIQEWNANHQQDNEQVILYIHGFPGCSDQARMLTSTPLLTKFRLLAIDRPGYGQSQYQPQLTPVKFAHQLLAILDHLGIERVSILSVSGGAPYAMALAHLLQERAIKLCSIGGIAPLTRKNRQYMKNRQKKAWWFNKLVPTKLGHFILNRFWQRGLEQIDKMLFTSLKDFSEPDRIVFAHPEISPVLAETLKQALKNGPHGVLHDIKTYSNDWGFPLAEIGCPVTLWHGADDDVVDRFYAGEMKRNLSRVDLKIIPDEGHYSIAMNYRDQILSDLLADS